MRTSASNDNEGKEPLTERQKAVLDFISRSIESRGYPPTLREIGEHMGIRSTNGVNDHLKALEKKGYLEREDLKSRALRPISFEAAGPTGHMIDAGIFDGDFIFVKKQLTAHRGDIVVAMIGDEATVKYFYPEGDQIVFKP